MSAIMINTRYDTNRKYRRADGAALVPGSLFLQEGGNGTVYVLNYKMEKQPINYAGFMKYYKASDTNPFSEVKTIPVDESVKYPLGSLITDNTEPAILQAPASASTKKNTSKYIFYGIGFIGIALLLWKYKSKLGIK